MYFHMRHTFKLATKSAVSNNVSRLICSTIPAILAFDGVVAASVDCHRRNVFRLEQTYDGWEVRRRPRDGGDGSRACEIEWQQRYAVLVFDVDMAWYVRRLLEASVQLSTKELRD